MRNKTVLNCNQSRFKAVSGIKLTGTYDGFTDVKRQCNWFFNDRKMRVYPSIKTETTEENDDTEQNQLA